MLPPILLLPLANFLFVAPLARSPGSRPLANFLFVAPLARSPGSRPLATPHFTAPPR